jgi:hypothetical protein
MKKKPEMLGIVKHTKTQLINCVLAYSNFGFWEYAGFALFCYMSLKQVPRLITRLLSFPFSQNITDSVCIGVEKFSLGKKL